MDTSGSTLQITFGQAAPSFDRGGTIRACVTLLDLSTCASSSSVKPDAPSFPPASACTPSSVSSLTSCGDTYEALIKESAEKVRSLASLQLRLVRTDAARFDGEVIASASATVARSGVVQGVEGPAHEDDDPLGLNASMRSSDGVENDNKAAAQNEADLNNDVEDVSISGTFVRATIRVPRDISPTSSVLVSGASLSVTYRVVAFAMGENGVCLEGSSPVAILEGTEPQSINVSSSKPSSSEQRETWTIDGGDEDDDSSGIDNNSDNIDDNNGNNDDEQQPQESENSIRSDNEINNDDDDNNNINNNNNIEDEKTHNDHVTYASKQVVRVVTADHGYPLTISATHDCNIPSSSSFSSSSAPENLVTTVVENPGPKSAGPVTIRVIRRMAIGLSSRSRDSNFYQGGGSGEDKFIEECIWTTKTAGSIGKESRVRIAAYIPKIHLSPVGSISTSVGSCEIVVQISVENTGVDVELRNVKPMLRAKTARQKQDLNLDSLALSPSAAAAASNSDGASIVLSETLVPWGIDLLPAAGTVATGRVAFQCGKFYFVDVVIGTEQPPDPEIEIRVQGHKSSSVHLRGKKGAAPMQHVNYDYKGTDHGDYRYTLKIDSHSNPPLATGRYYFAVFGMQVLPKPFSTFELSVGVKGDVKVLPDERDTFFIGAGAFDSTATV